MDNRDAPRHIDMVGEHDVPEPPRRFWPILQRLFRRRIGRMNGIFAPPPAPPASAGGRGRRAASAAPPARCDGPRKRRAARRGTAWRALDRQVRMREGRASGGYQGRGPRDGPDGKAEGDDHNDSARKHDIVDLLEPEPYAQTWQEYQRGSSGFPLVEDDLIVEGTAPLDARGTRRKGESCH
jgi:hypothetical protein